MLLRRQASDASLLLSAVAILFLTAAWLSDARAVEVVGTTPGTFAVNQVGRLCEIPPKVPVGIAVTLGTQRPAHPRSIESCSVPFAARLPCDFRALTPLIYNHVNRYGIFELNMDQRIPIETVMAA